MLGSAVVLGIWIAVLAMPFETHAVKLDMPSGNKGFAEDDDTIVSVLAVVTTCLFFAGINYLLLLGTRIVVNRFAKRTTQVI
jgi:hypothetical protein